MSNLQDWVTRQANGNNNNKASNRSKKRKKKTNNFDDNKTLMYRLRFAGKYVENKKKTFDRITRGPDEQVQASREARRRMVREQEREESEQRKLKQIQARDKAILRELNLGDFEKARSEQSVATHFQEKYGVLSEKFDYLSNVEANLERKLQQLEDKRTIKALANRATPAMLTKDVELLERLVLTRQQQTSSVHSKNDLKKERIDGQRMTLTLQKEKYHKMKEIRKSRETAIQTMSQREQELAKITEKINEKTAALSALLAEDAKAFKTKWKEKMKLLHIAQQTKKKEAVKDKSHMDHAAKILMLRRKASQNADELNKVKSSKEKRKQYIDSMEEAFETITRETGIESLDELVDTFLRSEHRNFSVYKHINELNRNIEEAVAETRVIKAELKRYSKQYSKSGVSRTEKVDELTANRKRLEEKANEYNKSTENYEVVSRTIQPMMLKLFSLMGCDQSDLNKELVINGINDLNIQSVLGIMEQQATTIANLYQKFTDMPTEKKKGNADDLGGEDSAVLGLLSAVSLKTPTPPSFGDFDPDENAQIKQSGRRASMFSVAPVDVTSVRLDVKNRVESGNYRRHRAIRRGPTGNLTIEERDAQIKQIKAMQKKIRKSKHKSEFDFDSDDEDKDEHQKKSRKSSGMSARRSSVMLPSKKANSKESMNKKNRRQSSVGMRRVLV